MIERSGPAIQAALRAYAPDEECAQFAAEFRSALARAAEDFDREQYNSLPAATQRLIDRRIDELLEDPTGDPHACYYRPHDEWSIPFAFVADEGFIYYGVADKPRRVVILRRLVFGG